MHCCEREGNKLISFAIGNTDTKCMGFALNSNIFKSYSQTGCSFPRNFANFRRNVGILIGSLL